MALGSFLERQRIVAPADYNRWLVPPAAFHFLSLLLGPWGSAQAQRIFTGG